MMESKPPLLSVVMLNYNYAQYLNESLNSVLQQTFKDYELIVIDDGSSDESVKVIEEFQKKYPWIQLLKNEKNSGIFEVTKQGVEKARGTYFYTIASDDVLLPHFFEKNINALQKYDACLSCSEYAYFLDGQPQTIKTLRLTPEKNTTFVSSKELQKWVKKHKFWIPGNTCLYQLNAFKAFGGYQASFHSHCDWFLALSVGFLEGIVYLPETLAAIRKHPHSYSTTLQQKRREDSWMNMISTLNQPSSKSLKKAFLKSDAFYLLGLDFFKFMLSFKPAWTFFKSHLWIRFFAQWLRKNIQKKRTQ